jgi:hypothetical protein
MIRKITILFLCICPVLLLANGGKKISKLPNVNRNNYAFSFATGGVTSFFKVDTRISQPATPLAGVNGMLRMHYIPASSFHLHAGFEIMTQGTQFNTYYFIPGYSILYDSNYVYTHRLRTLEVYIPLIARFGVKKKEENARALFYFLAGWSPKLLLSGRSAVSSAITGAPIWNGSTNLEYENWVVGRQTGFVLLGGIGVDKRIKYTENFISFELIYRHNLSRIRYVGNIDSNSLLIRNSSLNLQIGYRFEGGKARRGY